MDSTVGTPAACRSTAASAEKAAQGRLCCRSTWTPAPPTGPSRACQGETQQREYPGPPRCLRMPAAPTEQTVHGRLCSAPNAVSASIGRTQGNPAAHGRTAASAEMTAPWPSPVQHAGALQSVQLVKLCAATRSSPGRRQSGHEHLSLALSPNAHAHLGADGGRTRLLSCRCSIVSACSSCGCRPRWPPAGQHKLPDLVPIFCCVERPLRRWAMLRCCTQL